MTVAFGGGTTLFFLKFLFISTSLGLFSHVFTNMTRAFCSMPVFRLSTLIHRLVNGSFHAFPLYIRE